METIDHFTKKKAFARMLGRNSD